MATVKVVQDDITLDLVVWQAFGRQDDALVEQTLALNPGLSAAGVVLPVGTLIVLPEPAARSTRVRGSVEVGSGRRPSPSTLGRAVTPR